ncbi:MAG: hypothetical protein JWM27_2670 [Gemmatimonadetes bacterium]|nr:hypothetical protein [Gemmatimonadota bacterium]
MQEHVVRVRGRGTVEVPAYGMADAEHQVEAEVRAAWPDAAVEVLDVARPEGSDLIVEDFRVRYRVTGSVPVTAESPVAAAREAYRILRERFSCTRFPRIQWEPADRPAERPGAGPV